MVEGTTVLAEDCDPYNIGLYNESGATARLHGASFIAREGDYAWGIHNHGSGTMLVAESITALAENGNNTNYGLSNYTDAEATVDSSQFYANNNGMGVYLNGGMVSLGVSQLDGSAYRTSGTLTCFQVYDGNYAAYACP